MARVAFVSSMTGEGQIVLTLAANNDPTNAANVLGFQAQGFLVDIEVGGSQGTITLTFEESDTVTGGQTAILNKDLEIPKVSQTAFPPGAQASANVFAGLTFTDSGLHFIGYKGLKQFLRPVLTAVAGSPDFGIAISVIGTKIHHIGGPA